MHKVFSYVVATDVGVAPNVDGGVCYEPDPRCGASCAPWSVEHRGGTC